MEFTVAKQDLNKALQKIVSIVPTKTTIPILSNILLHLEDNNLTITGTDLEISISITIPVETAEEGSITVSARVFNEIVKEFPDIPLKISSDENKKITIVTEKGVYSITGQAVEDYPKIVTDAPVSSFDIAAETLFRLINKTSFAVSLDVLRPVLTGVYIEMFPDNIRFVATDGHRLAKCKYEDKSLADINTNLIIHPKALNLVMKTMEEGGDVVNISISQNHVVFKLDNNLIYAKLIEGQYPNYDRVIPTNNDKYAIINKEMLISSLRRVAIFSNSITRQVRFALSERNLTISSEDIEIGGEAKETIPIEYADENLEIGYNASYIIEMLRHIDTEAVKLEFKNPLSATILRATEDNENEDLMMLVMPIRLSDEAEGSVDEAAEEA